MGRREHWPGVESSALSRVFADDWFLGSFSSSLMAKAYSAAGQAASALHAKAILQRGKLNHIPLVKHSRVEPGNFLILVVVSMVFIVMVLGMSGTLYCLRHRSHHKLKEKLTGLGNDTGHDATAAYQDLCRQRMAVQTSERGERSEVFHPSHTSRINSVSSQFSDGPMQSPSARSSTSSWSEEPTQTNMDISTGHMILHSFDRKD
ncbi:hypothetical protein PO909_023842 [Leuciscus waleckii]